MDAPRKFAHWIAAIAAFVVCAGHAADRSREYHFSIERGSLVSVLAQLSTQTGIQIATQLNVSEGKTNELGPLHRHATVDEAIKELLGDTDMWYAWQDAYTIRIFLISSQRTTWSSDVVTAKEASSSIRGLAGVHYETGLCSDYPVGPFTSDQLLSAEEFWIEMIRPYCSVTYRRIGNNIEAGSINRLTIAGESKHDFEIEEMSRFAAIHNISAQAGGLVIGYISSDDTEEYALVGPIQGRMTVNQALKVVTRSSALYIRWVNDDTASVEPAYGIRAHADMSVCSCNFGLPEFSPLKGAHVTVIESRLPSIEADIPARSYERKEIEATGASSVPDFLRHVPQLRYMRPRGARLTGAQFAELQGLEPPYTLVLINGVRADISASELMTAGFDLNTIPIRAVERIEISKSSPSLVHGMDAIAGIVNIVLRDSVTTPFAEVRYGSASGGVRERIGTVAAGTSTDRARTTFLLDYADNTGLLGVERNRWRDMDYRRFGGPDRRSQYSAPPNVYTLDGQNLPGLDAPNAAVSQLPSGEIAFVPGETNLTSPLAMQSIVPSMQRTSLIGSGHIELGRSTLSGEALFVHRHTQFQMGSEIVPGFVMAPDHPENPFRIPIAVDAALTGLPPPAINSRSELLRGVARFNGPMRGNWKYDTFWRFSREKSSATRVNFVDTSALMSGLAATGGSAFNILSARPGASILAPWQSNSAESGGNQISARIDGPTPLIDASLTLGAEYRTEIARFESVGRLKRSQGSGFAKLKIPVAQHGDLSYGTRIDDFSDLASIRREQWGLNWRPSQSIELRAAYNEAYHPPSLYDLYLPRVTTPVPLFDSQRQEVTSVNFISGGNPDLSPATGASSTLGVTLEGGNAFTASIDLWRIRMRDHITPVAPLSLLANESEAMAGRVLRGTPTALDNQAGRPGRLLALDASRANVGEVDARGVDVSLQQSFETSVGTFIPRLDLTYIDAFRYSDLPTENPPVRDRAGIASVLGTLPSWRGTGSLSYSGYGWELAVFGRYHASYNDYSVAMGATSDREIPARALWDFTVSKKLGAHIEVTIGVSDVLNRAPPYAEVGDPYGFDLTQSDLTGRTAFIRVNGSM
jgi:iron complex outermembrane recepter protein